MIKLFFITATNTNIGKTYTTVKLLHEFASKGYKVGVIKPIESGVYDVPEDGMKLFEVAKSLNSDFCQFKIDDVVLYQFKLPASPYVANENQIDISIELIKEKIEMMSKVCDLILIEGAGGVMVPIKKDYFMIDLIKELRAVALLISHGDLGCINDTLLSLEALKNRDITHTFAINIKDNYENFEKISKKFFDDCFENIYVVDKDIEKICNSLLIHWIK